MDRGNIRKKLLEDIQNSVPIAREKISEIFIGVILISYS